MSKKKDYVIINKKMLWAIAPLMPLIGVILSKNRPEHLILLLVGVASGIFIGRYSKE
jgi:hypothetical protein